MKNQYTYNEKCILELVEYVRDLQNFIQNFYEVQNKPFFKKIVNFTIPESLLDDATKGILILYGKDPNVSCDTLKILQSISFNYMKDNSTEILEMLKFMKYAIPETTNDKAPLFRFLETLHYSEIIGQIAFTFSGNSYYIPTLSIASMVNKKKVKYIFETSSSPLFDIEEMITNTFEILVNENNGEKLYYKMNEVIKDHSFEENHKSA